MKVLIENKLDVYFTCLLYIMEKGSLGGLHL